MQTKTPTRTRATSSRRDSRVGATPRKRAASFSGLRFVSLVFSLHPFAISSCARSVFWLLSFGLLVRDWRHGAHDRPRDPPFTHPPTSHAEPEDEEEGDEESTYHQVPSNARTAATTDNSNSLNSPFADANRFSGPVSRPSMDAYGAFSDPAPSGFGTSSPGSSSRPPPLPEPDVGPKVSRTMQYADPYAVVRAQIAAGAAPPSPVNAGPPSYESYNGFR